MKSVVFGVGLAVAFVAGLGQVSAEPLRFIYKGTVTSGSDAGGFFGAAGTDLAGKSFEFVETFDPAKATGAYVSPYFTSSYGGIDYANSKLKIGSGAFYDIAGGETHNYSSQGNHSSWQFIGQSDHVGSVYSAEYTLVGFQAYAPSLTADNEPTEITFKTPIYGGYFSTYQYDYDTSTWIFESRSASASFSLQSLTVASVSAVPLPASASLFGAALLGLGAAGFTVRRRRAASASVA